MSTNTIKVVGNTGEVFISPQTTQTYKNITLFGYGYLDWGRVINQSLVTLIDSVETLSSGGMNQIVFDLENYTEEQNLARTQEFTLWKTEYKNLLDNTINSFVDTVNQNITQFKLAQNTINKTVSDELINLDTKITEEYNTFIGIVDQKIVDIVNTNLTSISDTINDAISASNNAISNLNSTKLSLDQKILEFNNLIANFKNTFQASFDTFKIDTAKTLEDNKNIVIQYVNEKLLGYGNSITSQSDRLDALELTLEGVNIDSLQNIIVTKVNDITTTVVNNYLSGLVTRVTTMESYFTNISATVTTKVNEILDPALNTVNNSLTTLENKFISYDSKLSNFNNLTNDLKTWVRDFDNLIQNYYSSKDEFMQELNNLTEDYSISAGRSTNLVSIIKKLTEANIKQTDYNNRNIINLIDQTQNHFIAGLRNTNFDENSLIRNETYRSNIMTNGLTNYQFNNIFKNTDFKPLEFGYSIRASDSKIKFIFLSLKIPDSALPNNFDMTTLKISLGGLLVPDTGVNYYKCPIFRMPRQYLALESLENYIPNYNAVIDANTVGIISESVYFSDIQSTDIIALTVHDNMQFTSDLPITISLGSNSVTFKIDELYNVSSGKFFNDILENIKSYSSSTQAMINNHILPYVTYSKSQNDITVVVNRIAKTVDGKEYQVKINLPDNGTLTDIVFNDGITDNVTKTFTNRNNFDFNLATYNANGWNTTLNFYKDILTTGILKFPIDPTATKVTGTINYKIDNVSKSEPFSCGSTPTVSTNQSDIRIPSSGYTEIDTQTIFGTIDAKLLKVDIKVYDEVTTSDTYQMWIDAKNLSSIVIRSNRYVRIYNEYASELRFYINIYK